MDCWSRDEMLAMAQELKPRAQSEGGAASLRLAEFPRHYTEIAFRCASGVGEWHQHWADTFFILEGSARLVTGGELVDAREVGPGEKRGRAITGESRQQLITGAVVHIPAGVAHQMILNEGEMITYFVVKIKETDEA